MFEDILGGSSFEIRKDVKHSFVFVDIGKQDKNEYYFVIYRVKGSNRNYRLHKLFSLHGEDMDVEEDIVTRQPTITFSAPKIVDIISDPKNPLEKGKMLRQFIVAYPKSLSPRLSQTVIETEFLNRFNNLDTSKLNDEQFNRLINVVLTDTIQGN